MGNYTYRILISLSAYLYHHQTSQDLAKKPKTFWIILHFIERKLQEANDTGIKSQLKTLRYSCMISKLIYISIFDFNIFLATELYDDHKCCIILPLHERTFPHSLHLMCGMLYTNLNVINGNYTSVSNCK